MIIRSQDKRKIETFERAFVYDGCKTVYVNGLNMGEYSTEEKAIKVLDMIKDAYCKMMFWNTATSGSSEKVGNCKEDIALKYIGQCSSNYCFQMPKDSEV